MVRALLTLALLVEHISVVAGALSGVQTLLDSEPSISILAAFQLVWLQLYLLFGVSARP